MNEVLGIARDAQGDLAHDASDFEGRTFVLTDSLVTAMLPDSVQSESFRALRSSLQSQHLKLGRRALAVCAAAEGTGASFVAANLAYVMSQSGVNTLLIDADMRTPTLANYIAPQGEGPGLADCLRNETLPLTSAVLRVQPNLSVLYAGHGDEQTFNRLGSSVFQAFIGQCVRDYDLTIIDTPPSNLYSDARRIAAMARHALIVTCRNRSFVKDVKVLIDELQSDGGMPIGIFQNDY